LTGTSHAGPSKPAGHAASGATGAALASAAPQPSIGAFFSAMKAALSATSLKAASAG
jgi:hypothetical protein